MAVVLRNLIDILRKENIELVAGVEGLERVVSFPHVVENQNVAEFLEGGEIIFTLGIALTEEFTIDDLVHSVYEKGVSAVILNVGPYIQEIPESVIQMGNQNHLPIFYMPWESYCPLVVKAITKEIVRSEENRTAIEIALKSVVGGATQKDLYEDTLSTKGWDLTGDFQVAIIKAIDSSGDMVVNEERAEVIKKSLGMLLMAQSGCIGIVRVKWGSAIVFNNTHEDKMNELISKIEKYLKGIQQHNEKLLFTLGGHVQGVEQVCRSFDQAKKVMSVYNLVDEKVTSGELLRFDVLGIYKLLLSIEDRKVLEEYYQTTIEPLVQYDMYHDTELCSTLKHYLEYNGSVNKVAEKLFVHRNTIGNQIHKIEDILQIDIAAWGDRSKLIVGFMAETLLKA